MPKNLISVLVIATILSLGGAPVALAAADAGEVLTFNGDCFVGTGGQHTALKMGDAVHVGDVVDVPDGAKLKLRMADGSVLSLGSGTRMTIEAYGVDAGSGKRDAKLGLGTGLLRAVVAKVTQPSKFEVDTATGVAAARSTDWFVETAPDRTTVGVLDGSVSFGVRDAKGELAAGSVLIPARSGSEIDATPPAPAATGTPAAATPRRLAPTPVVRWTQAQFDRLIDRTSVAFGLCQCIADTAVIHAECQTSVDSCKATCGSNQYSFIPNARQSCAHFYADDVVGHDQQH